MDIKIAVATHKRYWMPDDPVYFPLHVGKAGKPSLGYIGDDTGDNISGRNESFCELTGLYWVWKNVKADYKGIVHYRRHFTRGNPWFSKRRSVFRGKDFERLLSATNILVPDLRRYYIETNADHYAHAHYRKDLLALRQVIAEQQAVALPHFDAVMRRTGAHMFNMMVMRADLFDAYAAWLFALLFAVEQRIDISQYDSNQRRIFGYLSELLLDVWLESCALSYVEANVAFMEHQNWIKKGSIFLKRKIIGTLHSQ